MSPEWEENADPRPLPEYLDSTKVDLSGIKTAVEELVAAGVEHAAVGKIKSLVESVEAKIKGLAERFL